MRIFEHAGTAVNALKNQTLFIQLNPHSDSRLSGSIMTNSRQSNSVEKSHVKLGRLLSDSQTMNYSLLISEALQAADAPLAARDLAAHVSGVLPAGEDVETIVRQTVDKVYQAVQISRDEFGWLSNLIDGSIVRHPLTAEEARQGFLLLDELEHAILFPEFFQTHRSSDRILHVELFGGPTIPAEAYIERKTWSLRLGTPFVDWIDEQGGQGRDDLIITANDATRGHYTLRLHPREARDDSLIQSRNVQLTLKAEEIVREARTKNSAMTTWDLAAQLLAQNAYRELVPPDDLHCVLHQYSLLHFDSSVGYILKDEGVGSINSVGNQDLYSGNDGQDSWTDPKYDLPAKDESNFANVEGIAVTDEDYGRYLDKLFQSGIMDSPFTEQEYRMLRAELDSLIRMERKFGYLLSEQRDRQHNLITCLLIDPTTIGDDQHDYPGSSDGDEPPCVEG